MSYPKDKKEWWVLVESNWSNLMDMAIDKFQMNSPSFEEPGNANSKPTGRTILQEMNYLKENRDAKLARYFSAIWALSSDRYAYSKKGWSELCDLCSEEYVLFDEP